MKLSKKTIKNLTKIKNELPELAKKIPSIIEDFDMENFGCYYSVHIEDLNNDDICETYGCGLGNAARLFNIENKNYFEYNIFSYDLFCMDILPSLSDGRIINKTWYYLFSSDWVYTDHSDFNSFIQRIENLIKFGKKIKSFSYETNKIID